MSWFSAYKSSGSGDSGANSRPSRGLDRVNYNENSEEEDLETGLNFDSPLTSPGRPAQSPSVSPRALLIPDPPLTEEVLQEVQNKLADLPEEVVVEGHVVGHPTAVKGVENVDDDLEPAVMANFDEENGDDSATAMENLRSVQCPFNKGDIVFWFSQLEDQLTLIGVKKQWTKKIALVRYLPPEIQNEVKSLLKLQQTTAGTDIYLRIKRQLVKLYGPKPEDAYMLAKNLVLTDKPSQLGKQLVELLCPAEVKLTGCHCDRIIWGMFREKIPIIVRNHLADMQFNKDTYEMIFDKADQVWDSNRGQEPLPSRQVAAVAPTTSSNEVAAVQKGGQNKGKNKNKNKGQKGQNAQGGQSQGQNTQSQSSTPKVNDENLCRIHAKWKNEANFCAAPWACKMKNVYKAPQ